MSDWLQDLKPGDQVIAGNGRCRDRISVVERLTATQIIAGGLKYNRKTGKLIGSSMWDAVWIYEATPEGIEAIHRNNYVSQLVHLDSKRLQSLDTETLRAAVETLHTNAKPVE